MKQAENKGVEERNEAKREIRRDHIVFISKPRSIRNEYEGQRAKRSIKKEKYPRESRDIHNVVRVGE